MFQVKNISVFELNEMRKKNEEFFLIDVREQFEKDICDLGGVRMSYNDLTNNFDKIPRNQPVIVYCHYGERSFFITNFLTVKAGFKNVYNLAEGINAWAEKIDTTMNKY